MSDHTSTPSFEDFKLNKQLLNAITEQGFTTPTPIQEKTIPLTMAGHDIMGIAQTGTGKTAAYLLPILMKVKYAQGHNPRALILTPTRELAMQVNEHIKMLTPYMDIRHTAVYGGLGPKTQIETVKEGIDILVGTPGRIMELYAKQALVLKDIKFMVLDEADRMMDMGFMPQIRQMLEIIPVKRQNLLFSATMPDIVVRLSEEFLEFPQRIEVTPQATTAEMVEQEAYYVPNFKTKINLLMHLMEDQETFSRVIIFVRKKQDANNIGKYLERMHNGSVRTIHANKGQNSRTNAINDFKSGEIRFLVATDVAARGIDVSMVSHVINFDVPVLYEEYVHRVGRTGRANNTGHAITFINPAEKYHMKKIEELIRITLPIKDIPATVEIEKADFEERQDIAKEVDRQRKKEDPNFKGAFHEKKDKKLKQQHKRENQIKKARAAGKSSVFIGGSKKSKSSSSKRKSGGPSRRKKR
ncbi:DEAD/DEAH box helicase [Algivirga pacifica]|uniref:DEAD/DEAH box helicase n=1 Tax=Algivirga pacifica TaxID=1162670 RepID=A0ABP9D216_9BACT